ncbi:MAG: Bro-N domain-containing protein [Bacilli bacterium]|nr:Bro-N domain-containing protein [Bacilli bacterium]
MDNKLALFEEKEIRKIWKEDKWFFSIIDVILILTNSLNPRDYWYKLKNRVNEEEQIELSTICRRLKLIANDGKSRLTDCADTEGILRIIQSIPSPKAEPFKRWLAQVGSERIEEINNPELAMDRMKKLYEKKGYSKSWVEQRERGITTRHNLTDEWKERGVKIGKDYAILTNEIYKSEFGFSAKEYKNIKGLHESKNLRDSMTNIELALTNLGEATAVEFHKKNNSQGLKHLKEDMNKSGTVLNKAKKEIEKELKRPLVTSENYIELTKK